MEIVILVILLIGGIVYKIVNKKSDSNVSVIVNDQQEYLHNELELDLINKVNDYRISKGLNKLEIINHISFIASEHNEYMISIDKVTHDGFDKRSENIKNVLNAIRVGENIAFGFSSNESTLKSWINSNSHRVNLEGNYTHMGISIREDNSGRKYYTNIFIYK